MLKKRLVFKIIVQFYSHDCWRGSMSAAGLLFLKDNVKTSVAHSKFVYIYIFLRLSTSYFFLLCSLCPPLVAILVLL